MMDHIQGYINSDSDSYSDDEIYSHNKPMCKEDISGVNLNFFGLERQVSTSSANINDSNNGKVESLPYKSCNSSDIPDGDFWKDFVPDLPGKEICNDTYDSVKHHKKLREKITSVNKSKNTVRTQPYTIEHSSCTSYNERHITRSMPENNCVNLKSNSETTPSEKRKIFYVHSKVTPYLLSTSTCKCSSKSVSSWNCHDQAVNRLSWNRSNYSHLLLTAGMDSVVKIWNVWSSLDKCVSAITHHSKALRNAIWGRQGRTIISCGYDRTAIVTDVESGNIRSRHIHPGFVMACTLHPNNPNCFVTGTENLIQFWDQRTPMSPIKVLTFKDDIGQPQDLLFTQGGDELISCSDIVSRDSADRTIMAWDVKSGNVISNQIYQERYTCTRLKMAPSNSHFLAQTQGGYVALFSAVRPYKIDKNKRFEGHEMQGYNIGFDISRDGSLVYSGSASGGIHCYDYRSGKLIRKCADGQNDVVTDVSCHPVLPTVIASCTWGGSVGLWQ